MRTSRTLLLTLGLLGASCGPEEAPDLAVDEDPFSSHLATLMVFEFDGELLVNSSYNPNSWIEDQLLFTIGQLNGNNSVGRLDALTLSNVRSTREGSRYRIRYHASLPVAWGSKTNLPSSYELIFPIDLDSAAQERFATTYGAACADPSAHDLEAGNYWYYYRPSRSGCQVAAADVLRTRATASVSAENTNNKYPEYHQVWEDDLLIVVAIFGKYEDGATTASDAGIAGYNRFLSVIRAEFSNETTIPADLGTSPGVSAPDVTIEATLADGRRIRVHALLVDNVRTAGAAFDARYAALSTEADLIAYNGHAGLGSNVRALARKGQFRAGKYQIVFMNGCDTFAYVDGALAESRARLNPGDPEGTQFMEIITNARPSYFATNAAADMALIRGLLAYNQPRTYQRMFQDVDTRQVVVVTGEEDNVYYPGYEPGGGGGGEYEDLDERGSVGAREERRYQTGEAPAGTYVITMSHDPAAPGGDADLYVRAGAAPSSATYDCRPYSGGSNEECRVTLRAPAVIHVMIVGYASGANAYRLTVRAEGGGPGPTPWAGLNEQGTVAKNQELRFETTELVAGRYVFTMAGDGDADLYVRSGSAPSTSSYDCRPYAGNSNEVCNVTLSAPARVHVMVRGYAATSNFTLVGRPE
jgi:hypothetical protein